MTSKYLITLCLILCVVVQGKQTKDMEDCIANTSVMTDNAEVVANAIGNAVTSVNGATVQCENGLTLDEEDTSGIAVAVSTAVSTTMDAEANCTVNANANANGPFSVKDIVGSSMEMGFAMACIDMGETGIGQARAPAVKKEVMAMDMSNLANEVTDAIVAAVNEVLNEIMCGCGGKKTEPCSYNLETKEYSGHCSDTVAPECNSDQVPSSPSTPMEPPVEKEESEEKPWWKFWG